MHGLDFGFGIWIWDLDLALDVSLSRRFDCTGLALARRDVAMWRAVKQKACRLIAALQPRRTRLLAERPALDVDIEY